MEKINNLVKNILCIIIAILVSFMQMQFFEGSSFYGPASIIILVLTIPTIYLYFLPKHETMILVLYSFALVFILDFLGKEVNILLLLASLFAIFLLFTHSLYTANAKKTGLENPRYFQYIILLSILLILVSLSSYLIYEKVLKPNVNERNQLEIMYLDRTRQDQSNNDFEEEEMDGSSGAAGGGGGQNQVFNLLEILKYLLLALLLALIGFIVYKLYKFISWRIRLASMSRQDQIQEIYAYVLSSLNLLGLGRKSSETPLDYFKSLKKKDGLVKERELRLLTESFIAVKYANRDLDDDSYHYLMEAFKNMWKDLAGSLGLKKYIRYLILR